MAGELTGEIREADIVDLAHDGRGIARLDGKVVFVAGALPGERVRLRVIKRRRQMDEAGLVDVLSASPDRVVPACAHFGICGGCSLLRLHSLCSAYLRLCSACVLSLCSARAPGPLNCALPDFAATQDAQSPLGCAAAGRA